MSEDVRFEPITPDELPAWIVQSRDGYAKQMHELGGMSEAAAEAKADADMDRLFPEGQLAPGHEVVMARDSHGLVGYVWLALPQDDAEPVAYVYDVEVDAARRGQGHGRQLMHWAIERSRAKGATALQLNVFGGNAVARKLYDSLGFIETGITMSLEL
jgi:ribosomal protein S18 acetylase RimI-like enzyme